MKKTVTIVLPVLFVLALAYTGLSYWIGGQARTFHEQGIERINGSKNLKASVVSYKRGLFSSRALTKLTLVLPRQHRSISFDVVDTIYNGPFVFLHDPHFQDDLRPVMAVIRTRLAPGAAGLKQVLEKVPELASSEVLTVVSIGGGGSSYLEIPPFQHSFPDKKGGQTEVKWGGLTGRLNFDAQQGKAVFSCNCPLLFVTGQGERLRIEKVQGHLDSHAGIKGISVGSTAFSIGDIESVKKGQSVFTLSSFDLKAQSGVVGDRINGGVRLDFNKLNAGGLGLGPFTMEFDAQGLDAGVLSRFQREAPALQRAEMGNDEAAKEQAKEVLAKLAVELLASRPEFEIKQLDLRTDKGDLTGKAKLGFDGNGKGLSRNILALLTSIDASAELSVSQALFYFVAQNALRNRKKGSLDSDKAKADVGQLVTRLLASKYMIAEAGAFKSSAAFKHGVLTVNGRRLGL